MEVQELEICRREKVGIREGPLILTKILDFTSEGWCTIQSVGVEVWGMRGSNGLWVNHMKHEDVRGEPVIVEMMDRYSLRI